MSSTNKLQICLIGARGKMGSSIEKLARSEFSDSVEIAATIDRTNSSDFASCMAKCEVFLDVSLPSATLEYIHQLSKAKTYKPYVIGCTGWKPDDLAAIGTYARHAPVLLSPNFSPAVALFIGLVEKAGALLGPWGYEVTITETHHAHKIDAPSGTAKAIVERLGTLKPKIQSVRTGNVVGEHEVRFAGPADTLTLKHEALDRSVFARGALSSAQWISSRPGPGLFSMKDIISG
jgi:4-hydroxy-tetrahydrodipicolinate reductase